MAVLVHTETVEGTYHRSLTITVAQRHVRSAAVVQFRMSVRHAHRAVETTVAVTVETAEATTEDPTEGKFPAYNFEFS